MKFCLCRLFVCVEFEEILRRLCVLGEDIPAGARAPPAGAVLVQCSNERCPAVPWLHRDCYEKWEHRLYTELAQKRSRIMRSKGRENVNLWRRPWHELLRALCMCPAPSCGGYLCRDVNEEKAVMDKVAPSSTV